MNVNERNRMELLAYVGVLIAAILAMGELLDTRATNGTTFVLLADANCVQTAWGGPIPFAYDPNTVAGVLIDVEDVTAGKYNRTGRCCDPEGDPFTIELLVAPAGMQVTQDAAAGTWTLAGDLTIGVHAIVVHAVDAPEYGEPNDCVVTVLVRAGPRPNVPPAVN